MTAWYANVYECTANELQPCTNSTVLRVCKCQRCHERAPERRLVVGVAHGLHVWQARKRSWNLERTGAVAARRLPNRIRNDGVSVFLSEPRRCAWPYVPQISQQLLFALLLRIVQMLAKGFTRTKTSQGCERCWLTTTRNDIPKMKSWKAGFINQSSCDLFSPKQTPQKIQISHIKNLYLYITVRFQSKCFKFQSTITKQ